MNEGLLQNIDFAKGDGLIPVVVQHADDGAVLMLGYANREAMEKTVSTGKVHFWSRSRRQLWLKGEKSGNYLLVDSLLLDCDRDTVLALVRPATGSTPVCHTGADTCFNQPIR